MCQASEDAPMVPMTLEGNVLVTGGTGFLGRSILRVAARDKWPCSFVVFSRDPEKQQRLREQFPDLDLTFRVGDVRDYGEIETAMRSGDLVLHLAAFKHIPEAEANPSMCLRVNVDGTRNVIRAAIRVGARQLVGISTDKATRPINVYGLTKALLEKQIFEAAHAQAAVKMTLARYGNVVGSTGSVVPVWARQIADGRPLTITDPAMTRFWLDADEAVAVVLRAYVMTHGACHIPKLPAMKVGDMAKALHPGADTTTIGLRPGEKLHEDLLQEQESYWAAEDVRYYVLAGMMNAPIRDEPLEPYTSAQPASWMSADEFRTAVLLGERI